MAAFRYHVTASALLFMFCGSHCHADGAGDNSVQNVRHIPPIGVSVADSDRAELQLGLDTLQKAIDELKQLSAGTIAGQPPLLPDVEIYHKAVFYALKYPVECMLDARKKERRDEEQKDNADAPDP